MNYKLNLVSRLVLSCACSLTVLNSYADIIGEDAFLIAENVVAGIGKDGAFGSVSPIPVEEFNITGIGGNRIGYLSDPSSQSFAGSFHGDFFFPGFPEEGWAVRVNNQNFNNNRNEQTIKIPGGLSNFQIKDRFSSVDWIGEISNLEIKQTFRTYNKGLSIIIDVEMTNGSTTDMDDVYFMRTVDPDNNHSNITNPTGTFETTNLIVKQGDVDSLSAVSAGQADGSLVTLSGYSENSRVAHGGERIRDPAAVYNGTGGLKQVGTSTEDRSIAVAFKFDKILPGETVAFTHAYGLADLAIPDVELDPDSDNGSFEQVYLLGTSGIPIADTDATISGTTAQLLQGLKVKLTNPLSGDLLVTTGALPAGTTKDINEVNNDIEINITGPASVEEYMNLLKSIRFENQDLDASLITREIVVQVLDESFILSNGNNTKIFMTVPLVINPNISGDNVLSYSELSSDLTISGTAAADSNLELTLTDSKDNTIVENFIVNPNGTWTRDIANSDLPTLVDGSIQVAAKSTDAFSNVTTDDATFLKDTIAELTVSSPIDNTQLTVNEVIVAGDSEPNANVTVTTIDGKECTSVADVDGKWSCTLTELEKGKTYPLTVVAIDDVGNESTQMLEVSVSNIDLIVESPAYEAVAEDTTPIITGKTEPNHDLTITTEFGKVCTTIADAAGNWSCELEEMPSGGGTTNPNLEITVTTELGTECKTTSDASGNWSCELSAMPAGGPQNLSVEVKNPTTNSVSTLPWAVTIPPVALDISEPAFNAVVDDATPLIKGNSDPGTEITIQYDQGKECNAVADANGDWNCELDELPIGGPYDLEVTAKDPRTDSSTTVPWRVGVLEPSLEVTEPVTDETATDSPLVFKGQTNPNAEITIEGPDGQSCTTFADAAGEWTCDLVNVGSGEGQDFTVTATTPGGIKKVEVRQLDVEVDDGIVTTALRGGAGSFSSFWLLLIFSLVFLRKIIRSNKYFSKS